MTTGLFALLTSYRLRDGRRLTCLFGLILGLGGSAAAEPGAALIRVRALDAANQRPIAQAKVAVTADRLPQRQPGDFGDPSLERLQRRDLPANIADDNGAAAFEGLEEGRWLVEVWADGYVKQWREIVLGDGPVNAALDFHLQPGTTIVGTVHDADQNPMPGSIIVVSLPPQTILAVTRADGNGHYRLPPVAAGMNLDIHVSASQAGFESASKTLLPNSAMMRFDVALAQRPRGGAVSGRVVDQAGKPVVGAAVEHESSGAAGEPRRVMTDAAGHFLFDDLNGNPVELVVRAAGLKAQHVDVPTGTDENPAAVTITLEPGFRAVGRVVDDQDQPLAGVAVAFFGDAGPKPLARFLPPHGLLFGRTSTNDEGRFEFDSLPATCRAAASKTGYITVEGEPLTLDSTGEQKIVVERLRAARLLVTDADTREPLRHFKVRFSGANFASPPVILASERLSRRESLFQRLTHAPPIAVYSTDGSCEIPDLPPERRLEAIVDAPGYIRQYSQPFVPAQPGSDASVSVELHAETPERLVHFRGQLVDDRSAALAAAELHLIVFIHRPKDIAVEARRGFGRRGGRPPAESMPWAVRLPSVWDGSIAQHAPVIRFERALTDAEGRFEFSPVPRTQQIVVVWRKPGIAPGKRDALEKLSDQEARKLELHADPAATVIIHADRKVFPQELILTMSSRANEFRTIKLPVTQDSIEIDDLAAGTYQISGGVTRGPKPGRYVQVLERTFELVKGERLELELSAPDRIEID